MYQKLGLFFEIRVHRVCIFMDSTVVGKPLVFFSLKQSYCRHEAKNVISKVLKWYCIDPNNDVEIGTPAALIINLFRMRTNTKEKDVILEQRRLKSNLTKFLLPEDANRVINVFRDFNRPKKDSTVTPKFNKIVLLDALQKSGVSENH